jgi:hypothetical protein
VDFRLIVGLRKSGRSFFVYMATWRRWTKDRSTRVLSKTSVVGIIKFLIRVARPYPFVKINYKLQQKYFAKPAKRILIIIKIILKTKNFPSDNPISFDLLYKQIYMSAAEKFSRNQIFFKILVLHNFNCQQKIVTFCEINCLRKKKSK